MAMEFLLVKCPDDVEVFADGDAVGRTNRTMMLTTGSYAITLDTPDAYVPATQDAVLVGTALTAPLVLTFSQALASRGPVGGARPGPVGGTRPGPVGGAAPAKRRPTATKKAVAKKVAEKKPPTKKVAKRASRKKAGA